ncbi:MAG: glycosyltransferase family 2 protein [Geobacteraceae bacterium]|nr:glycosyltransferase family 2 protein [Geobacteraceae bacterium]
MGQNSILPRVTVVIPVHNRRVKTLRCLKSLFNAKNSNHELSVIVVDDGSSDGTAEAISQCYPQVRVISGTGNLLWTGAVNVGIKEALDTGTNFVLILNDDSVHEVNFINNLVSCSKEHNGAITGAKILYLSKRQIIRFAGADWNIFKWGWHYPHNLLESSCLGATSFKVKSINGNCCLIPADVFNRIGLYDEVNYPHLYADSAFTIQAGKSGIPLFIEPRATIWDDDTDIAEKLTGPSLDGVSLIKYVFTRKTSPYYFRAFFLFTITTAPLMLGGFILYCIRMSRISLRILLSIVGLRAFYQNHGSVK